MGETAMLHLLSPFCRCIVLLLFIYNKSIFVGGASLDIWYIFLTESIIIGHDDCHNIIVKICQSPKRIKSLTSLSSELHKCAFIDAALETS